MKIYEKRKDGDIILEYRKFYWIRNENGWALLGVNEAFPLDKYENSLVIDELETEFIKLLRKEKLERILK